MASCKTPEPMPVAVYAPASYRNWLEEMNIIWLGDMITNHYRRYVFSEKEIQALHVTSSLKHLLNRQERWEKYSLVVLSGPYCRLYWGNGKPDPHAYESAWQQDKQGKWTKPHPNFLSYDVSINGIVTQFTVKKASKDNVEKR